MKLERIGMIGDDRKDVASAGEFSARIVTQGEASDGHLLRAEGGVFGSSLPMLQNHNRKEVGNTLGRWDSFAMSADADAVEGWTSRGHIQMGGEGAQAEARRDLAHMIAEGDINGVSTSWDPKQSKYMRRATLPRGHFARATTGAGSRGMYFEDWIPVECSICCISKDRRAAIGRAESTTGELSEWWRGFADGNDPENVATVQDRSLSELSELAELARSFGVQNNDLINAVAGLLDFDGEPQVLTIAGRALIVPKEWYDRWQTTTRDYSDLLTTVAEIESAEEDAAVEASRALNFPAILQGIDTDRGVGDTDPFTRLAEQLGPLFGKVTQ